MRLQKPKRGEPRRVRWSRIALVAAFILVIVLFVLVLFGPAIDGGVYAPHMVNAL